MNAPIETESTLHQALDLYTNLVAGLERDQAVLERSLSAPVLDGTPYVVTRLNGSGLEILGEWNDIKTGTKQRGFLSFHAVPLELCGAYCNELSQASLMIRKLIDSGTPGHAFSAAPIRSLIQRQLGMVVLNLRTYREAVDSLKAKLAGVSTI